MLDNSSPSTKTIQQAIIETLEAIGPTLTHPGHAVVVEAWNLPQRVSDPCSNDSADGPGYCYGPTGDPLCLLCQSEWIKANSPGGLTISIDVAR